jgi:hypothetical protein
MNTNHIIKVMNRYPNFGGVFPSNRIKIYNFRPNGLIVNLDPDYKPGIHWVSLYVNEDDSIDYFDSFGFPFPFPNLLKFEIIMVNKRLIQPFESEFCGVHAMHFLICKFKGYSNSKIMERYNSLNLETNDQIALSNVLQNL